MIMESGEQFRDLRVNRLKLTQEQLAKRLGVTTIYISFIETGRREISMKVLRALSREFGLSFTVRV